MVELRKLFDEIGQAIKRYQQIATLSGDNFNLFRIINVTSEEVRLHSRFLAELLNSSGVHGQGNIFLNLFVAQLGITDFDAKSAKIYTEYYIGPIEGNGENAKGGQLDIYIKDSKNNGITIENKIYASDQPDQIRRYYNFCSTNLFYLTLNGDIPSDISTKGLENGQDYNTISYSTDIIRWLESCKKEAVDHPLLREGISHYINLLKHLTNQSTNQAMNTKIVNIITQTPEKLRVASELANSYTQSKIEIQQRFWRSLHESLVEAKLQIEDSDNTLKNINKYVENYYLTAKNNKYYGVNIVIGRLSEDKDVVVKFEIRIDHNIYVGFTFNRNGDSKIAQQYSTYTQALNQSNSAYSYSPNFVGWRHTSPILNFRDFSSDAIFSCADPKILRTITDDIARMASEDIKWFCDKFTLI